MIRKFFRLDIVFYFEVDYFFENIVSVKWFKILFFCGRRFCLGRGMVSWNVESMS